MPTLPAWIRPGDAATLIWHGGVAERPDGVRLYTVSGPALGQAPPSPYFILAPADLGDFAGRLYRGQVDLPGLRRFLEACVLARGELVEELQFVAVSVEAPVLPLLDAWRGLTDRPVLPYLADINAFVPTALPLYVTAAAHAEAQRRGEHFSTAWVCDECGEAEDAAVFLWTACREDSVRVCFLIQNDAGVWSCRLHPFEFKKEAP